MGLLRPKSTQLDSQFLLYYFLSPPFQETIRARTIHGSTVERLALDEVRRFPVWMPPLLAQREIAGLLGALDEKIDQNRQTTAALEALGREIFQSWFVDFDPVVAKSEGRQPFGMDAETAALFPSRFVESELGPIPDGWRTGSLDEACEINPKRVLRSGSPAAYLDMRAMPTGGAIPAGWKTRVAGSGMRFKNGDTLVARITPCLENGKTAYVTFLADGEVGWGSTEYIVLRAKEPLPLEYSYLLARLEDFRDFAIINMTGSSGRQRVNADVLKRYRVIIPEAPVCRALGEIVRPLFELMSANAAENRTLVQLRDTLLPKLMSGEIRLKQADKTVGAAV